MNNADLAAYMILFLHFSYLTKSGFSGEIK